MPGSFISPEQLLSFPLHVAFANNFSTVGERSRILAGKAPLAWAVEVDNLDSTSGAHEGQIMDEGHGGVGKVARIDIKLSCQ